MSNLIKKYPALSLFILAMILGAVPIALVTFGLLPPVFTQLGALSAGIAGIILASVEGGKNGFRELLGRVLIWRVGIGWWLFALLFPVIPSAGALYLSRLFGGPEVDWKGLSPLYNVISAIFVLFILAGLGEEFGWRGFAIPRLQTRYNALVTSLIIGFFHSLWHIPLFFIEGSFQYTMANEIGLIPAVLGYSVFVIAFAVQLSWIFNNTKGSILLVALYHGSINAWNGYINIYRGGSMGGIYAYIVLMVIVSIVIVLIYGVKNLTRK